MGVVRTTSRHSSLRPRRPWPVVLAALLALSLAPPPPASAQAANGSRTVTVRSGDTLDGISQRTGVSVAELKRINGLKDADLLQVGQVLRLSSPPRRGGVVVVKSGDTLEIIAKAHNTSVAALQKANPGVQPERLKVGSSLRLPAASSQPVAAKSAAPAPAKPTATTPTLPPAKPPTAPTSTPPPEARVPDAPPLTPPTSQPPASPERTDAASRGRWRY
jgi:LysM repeat protein